MRASRKPQAYVRFPRKVLLFRARATATSERAYRRQRDTRHACGKQQAASHAVRTGLWEVGRAPERMHVAEGEEKARARVIESRGTDELD